ncbi:lipopolysaccharide kinase InaA family protein [Dactylosporangium sp. AC04546]|uniref:lipopolysaccharide kinase InaA family protein n=1 Tax=Dactylosporangium sp. AC04546 TaxID=2862460 RepID=UPI001EDDC6E1|nr:lipopolysaccharide kinase InaA family protein [Dactylosporangium sp. AC04546]WVK86082.1 lipopolysaccharide kinase InaA family protein [Dactylosporangium sp. AC04546]
MTPLEAIAYVETATADELFGGDDPARQYRRLARLTHPDTAGPGGARAFARLAELWHSRGTIRSPRGRYSTNHRDFEGDLANLYRVPEGHLKLVRDPSCNDLMAREAKALRRLAERGDPRYLPYVPRLVDSFRHKDGGVVRRANVIATTADDLHSLSEIKEPLDPRDAAWMWRRLLVALGMAHRAGVVHGAVLPEHVLIQPEDHGVILVDWCYSAAEPGERIAAIVPRHRDHYPPEVLAKETPGPFTDLAMAARLMTDLMGDRAPQPLRRFADGCRLASPRQRPDDAWWLLAELDELLHRLYGPRKFRPFTL